MMVFLLCLAAVVSLALSAFCSGTETAFLSVSRERILHLAKEGGKKAKLVKNAIEDMGKTTTTLLVANNIVNVSYSSAAAALVSIYFSKDSIGNFVFSLLAAFLVLYFSEFMPKLLCSARPLRSSLLFSSAFRVVSVLISPLTYIAMKFTDLFIPKKDTVYKLTAADLINILEDRKDGVCLSDLESALIGRIIVLRAKRQEITTESILAALRDFE